MVDPAPPIACTLLPDELRAAGAELIPGLAARAATVEALADGLRLTFAPSDGVVADIARVIDRERRCCRFLHFALRVAPDGGPIALDITGPAGTREMLSDLAGRLSPAAHPASRDA